MEEIKKTISKRCGSVRLFLEDINKIVDILKKNGFTSIKLRTENYYFLPDEITELEVDQVSFLEISAHAPLYISIDFEKSHWGNGVRIYCEEDTVLASGVISKIQTILNKNKRVYFNFFSKFRTALMFLVLGQAGILFLAWKNIISVSTTLYSLGGILLVYFFFGLLDSGYFFKKNILIFKKRKDTPGFWRRNKDNVILAIITAVLSIGGTLIITRLF